MQIVHYKGSKDIRPRSTSRTISILTRSFILPHFILFHNRTCYDCETIIFREHQRCQNRRRRPHNDSIEAPWTFVIVTHYSLFQPIIPVRKLSTNVETGHANTNPQSSLAFPPENFILTHFVPLFCYQSPTATSFTFSLSSSGVSAWARGGLKRRRRCQLPSPG